MVTVDVKSEYARIAELPWEDLQPWEIALVLEVDHGLEPPIASAVAALERHCLTTADRGRGVLSQALAVLLDVQVEDAAAAVALLDRVER